MRIQTPKKYRGVSRRQVFSCQRFFVALLMLLFIGAGLVVYQNRDWLQPQADRVMTTAIVAVDRMRATAMAPTAAPTIDPARNLAVGANAWSLGNLPDAMQTYTEILDSVPNDTTVYSRVSLGYHIAGREADALTYAERTVTADPLSADAWAIQSYIQSVEGDPLDAIASALQALDLQADHPGARAYLGFAYLTLDRADSARSQANQVINDHPERFEGYWLRGRLRDNLDFDFDGALADYRTAYDLAVEQNPALAENIALDIAKVQINIEFRTAAAAGTTGDYSDALATIESILEMNPDHVGALYWKGVTYYSYAGDRNQALDPLDECATIDTNNFRCWYLLGRTQFFLGDQESALQSFIAAVDANTTSARHYWWVANTYGRALGNCAQAESYLRTGYRMALPGDLPAEDEGVDELIEAFEFLITTCQSNIPLQSGGSQSNDEADPTPEATAEAEPGSSDI